MIERNGKKKRKTMKDRKKINVILKERKRKNVK